MATNSWQSALLRSKLFWALVSVPVIGLVTFICNWYAQRSLVDAKLAELRANGLPTTASEVDDFYVVPDGVTDTTNLWVAAIDAVRTADLSTRGKTLPIIGNGSTRVPPPGEPWAELEASRTLLGELDKELQLIYRAAAAGGQIRFPTNYSAGMPPPFFDIGTTIEVSDLLKLGAHVSAHDGDDERTLQDLTAIFALSDAMRDEPSGVSQMVRRAFHSIGSYHVERLLPHCRWNDAKLQSLQVAIGSAQFKDELSNAVCGERAFCLSMLDDMTLGPSRQANKLAALRFFGSSIEGYAEPWPAALQKQREINAEITRLEDGKVSCIRLKGVLLIMPAFSGIDGARVTARQRCAIAGIATQRHWLKHGRLPNSLAEIDAELLGDSSEPSVQLTDPFNGQPLRYMMEETRVVIYSVGSNQQDDGGHCGLKTREPRDVGFTLKR
ncbi:MAG: hypothetical protein HON53_05100 [Planctomycetaceae bacterium]|jgi:hypothetical protein|nr:hypothetical protein [Planctomycetaceae bacterium]MBT6155628.1 hypothetical protein [Planctomycetaceae bacterium]MBT6483801.1 hypothetical protein [Planctomycetaceae bacterium]MBT6496354.1 hypothetical protein [Planctomycetaceae bacterium]